MGGEAVAMAFERGLAPKWGWP